MKKELTDKYKRHLEHVEKMIEKYSKYHSDNSANLVRYLRGQKYVLEKILLDLNNCNL